MPISREAYDKGRTEDSDEEKMLKLLNANLNQAFTSKEIATRIGHHSASPVPESPAHERNLREIAKGMTELSFSWWLDSLVTQGKIDSRLVQVGSRVETYYTAKRR